MIFSGFYYVLRRLLRPFMSVRTFQRSYSLLYLTYIHSPSTSLVSHYRRELQVIGWLQLSR